MANSQLNDAQAKRKFRRPLRSLTRVFTALILIFISIIFYKLNFVKKRLLEVKPLGAVDGPAVNAYGPIGEPQPFEYYSDIVKARDIFSLEAENPAPVTSEDNTATVVPEKNITDMTSSLKLVGIILSGEPEAVFENQQNQETVFLQKGARINEAVVEEIREGVVTLNYAGQKIDMRVDNIGQ